MIDKLFLEDYGMPIEITPETIIDFPDTPAEFPKGSSAMKEFIRKTVNYPVTALRDKQEGKVYLSFIIELDGSISNVKLLRGVCQSIDKEAKRVVRNMPNWSTGTYKGHGVRTRCRIPITFVLTVSDD